MSEHPHSNQSGFRIAAGLMNYFGVILGAVALLALLLVLTSLFSWLKQDLSETFTGIGENLNEAVVVENAGTDF